MNGWELSIGGAISSGSDPIFNVGMSRRDGAIVDWQEVPGTVMYVMRPALPLRNPEQSAARGSREKTGPRGPFALGGASRGEEVKRDALRTVSARRKTRRTFAEKGLLD